MISDEKRLRIAELAGSGMSVRQVAEQLGISPATVSRHAKAMGVPFDRSATERATAARMADGRARRAETAARLLELANAELDRLGRPHRIWAFVGGAQPTYLERVLPEPDPPARLALIRGATTLLDRHVKLLDVGTDQDTATEEARSMLGRLAADLGRWSAEHITDDGEAL